MDKKSNSFLKIDIKGLPIFTIASKIFGLQKIADSRGEILKVEETLKPDGSTVVLLSLKNVAHEMRFHVVDNSIYIDYFASKFNDKLILSIECKYDDKSFKSIPSVVEYTDYLENGKNVEIWKCEDAKFKKVLIEKPVLPKDYLIIDGLSKSAK